MYAKHERDACCDALSEAGPDAPTLCEGWTASDLAAHLYVREYETWAASGMAIPPLAGLLDGRMRAAQERLGFDGLVSAVRNGPPPLSPFSLPGMDEKGNLTEYFVHTEDVRRPAGLAPRELPGGMEDALWARLSSMGRLLLRRSPDGVVLEREGTGESLHASPGAQIVTVIGKPSELLLFAFGRRDAAVVRFIGEPGAIMRLKRA